MQPTLPKSDRLLTPLCERCCLLGYSAVDWGRGYNTAPQVEDVEIDGSHTGMGWNPALLAVLADRLAEPEGRWQPYVRQ